MKSLVNLRYQEELSNHLKCSFAVCKLEQMNFSAVLDCELSVTFKGLISDEYIQHVTESIEHKNPVIKSSKRQSSQDSLTGGVLLGHW